MVSTLLGYEDFHLALLRCHAYCFSIGGENRSRFLLASVLLAVLPGDFPDGPVAEDLGS